MRELRDAGFPAAQGRGGRARGRAGRRHRCRAGRPPRRRLAAALAGLRRGLGAGGIRRPAHADRRDVAGSRGPRGGARPGGGRPAGRAGRRHRGPRPDRARRRGARGDPGAVAAGAGRRGRRARGRRPAAARRAPRSPSPWPAPTVGPLRRRGRRRPSRCATCSSGSGRRSWATRSSRCSRRASRRTRTRSRTPVAFDTQIAAYLVNAALRAQKIADVVAERLDLVLPPTAAGLSPGAVAGLEALSVLAVRPIARAVAPRRGRRAPVRTRSSCR